MSRAPQRRAVLAPVAAMALALLAGCQAVGPDYQRPSVKLPQQWPQGAPGNLADRADAGWQRSQPADSLPKGAWWEVFGDAELNHLESQALAANQTLVMAQSKLEQARAQMAVANASLLPRLGLQAGTQRFRTSADRPLTSYSGVNSSVVQNDYNTALTVSYELDVVGRLRRQAEGAQAGAQQAEADLENTRLLLAAQLASSYWALRELDGEIAIVQQTIGWQEKALRYVQDRHDLGAASELDVQLQLSTLSGTRAQWLGLVDQRARVKHAIATLVGDDAASFHLAAWAPDHPLPSPPPVALGQPSTLLERRPDIASAERAMAAANAQIGVARAGYFPIFNFSGLVGSDANQIANLLSAPSLLWSVGVAATQTLFDGGRTQAAVDAAGAAYRQAVASYRQTVLVAVQEVSDALTSQAAQGRAQQELSVATRAADKGLELSDFRYRQGAAGYLEVIVAQQNALSYRRQAMQNLGAQWLTTVQLVKASGGGYLVAQPTAAAN